MKSTTILGGILLPPDGQEVEASSLYQVLQEVTDSRKKRGRRYEATVALTIIVRLRLTNVVLAKLAGESGLSGMAHWARLRLEWLHQRPPLKLAALPCANTYQHICEHISLDELREKLGAYSATLGATAVRPKRAAAGPAVLERGAQHLALDGKSLRGAAGHQLPLRLFTNDHFAST